MAYDIAGHQLLADPMGSYAKGRALKLAEQKAAQDGQLLEAQIANVKQSGQIAANQDQRAAAEAAREETKFSQEQQIVNTKMLNAATAELAQNPSPEVLGRWMPQLKKSGVVAADFDPSGIAPEDIQRMAAELHASTSVALSALNPAQPKTPDVREFKVGNSIVTRQWDGKRWVDMEKAPRSEPSDSSDKPPSGYRWGNAGALEPIPGGPADPEGPAARKVAAPLRKEFRTLESVKAFETSLPLIKSAEKAPDTGFGDLQLIYTAGKVLDPGSVVREGELALTVASGSPLQRIIGQTRFTTEKGGRLTPKTRQQIIEMLHERVGAYEQAYNQDRETYAQYAKDAGLDAQSIVGKHPTDAYGTRTNTAPSGGAPQAGAVDGGYRFKGGDPSKRENWEKL